MQSGFVRELFLGKAEVLSKAPNPFSDVFGKLGCHIASI
jgi:hypothetical protein